MNENLFEPHRYEADTPEAVLQCAVAVACIDGEFASDERERVRKVYADICREMTYAYNAPDVSDEYAYIAESTADVALAHDDRELKLEYIDYRAELITDADLQELTLIMSLRIAGADAETRRLRKRRPPSPGRFLGDQSFRRAGALRVTAGSRSNHSQFPVLTSDRASLANLPGSPETPIAMS